MAFTSIGYDGSVNEKQWAELVPSVGSSTYGVKDADDLKVTAVAGQPFTLSVASGAGWGHGVLDTETVNTTVACATLSAGTRWDMIALRRNWQPLAGGPTSVVAVSGTATKELPGTRKIVPGVEDDQPLALVQWSSTQTQPVAIIDLRCWAGNGGMVANDPLVKLYLNKLGAVVLVGSTEWRCLPGDNDLPTWVGYNVTPALNGGLPADITAFYTGWTRPYSSGNRRPRVWSTDGVTAHISGVVQYQPNGASNIATIPTAFAPAEPTTLTYIGTTLASNGSSDPVNGAVIGLGIEDGALRVVYQSKGFAVGSFVPLSGSWLING